MRDLEEVMIKSLTERKIINREFVNGQLEASTVNNAKLIKEEAKELCGKYVDFFGCFCGYLIGAVCGHDDYYWVYIKKDRTVGFSSCVGNPNALDSMPNIDFSVLDYLIENDPFSLFDIIKERFKTVDDVFFTPIYINGKEYEIGDIV